MGYAQKAAKLGEDIIAEECFRLIIAKSIELLGKDHTGLPGARAHYLLFLSSRGRPEAERELEALEKDLEKYSLGNTLQEGEQPLVEATDDDDLLEA